MLSASANKLSRLKEQAEEYAALIMEELDPERLGYIEVGWSQYSVSQICHKMRIEFSCHHMFCFRACMM